MVSETSALSPSHPVSLTQSPKFYRPVLSNYPASVSQSHYGAITQSLTQSPSLPLSHPNKINKLFREPNSDAANNDSIPATYMLSNYRSCLTHTHTRTRRTHTDTHTHNDTHLRGVSPTELIYICCIYFWSMPITLLQLYVP